MRNFVVKAWLAALLLALSPWGADAAGLGRLTLLSALGQPLNAEIELVAVTKEELSSLNASLASPNAYRQANLQYNAALTGARISVEKRPDGQPYLKITSSRPVNEPFIDLLVELIWSSGRIVREYTALLDPPGLAPAPPAPAVSVAPPAPVTRPAPAPLQPPVAAAPSRPIAGAKEYGPIQRGETLGKIARSVMPQGVTLEQMLIALYRTNPDAFIRKNLNLVRAGKVLRVPEEEEVAAVTQGEAAEEYRTHVADWNAYRQKIADAAGVAPAEGRTAARGKITARVEDKGAGEPKDVVRLSKGEPPGAAPGKGKPRSTAERIRMLEEEVVAREKALNEANERVAQLEKTIKDMQKLVELKSPGLAAAQQQAQLAAKPKPEPAPAAKPKPAPKAEAAKKPEAPKPEAPKPEAVAALKPAEAPTPGEAPKPEIAAPADKPAAAKPEQVAVLEEPKPKPKPRVVVPPPPPPPSDLVDQIMEAVSDPLYLAAGGGVIVLGGLGFWMARRRRAREGAEETAPARSAPTLGMAPAAEAAAATGVASAAAPAEAPAAAAAAPSDDVDPLAEAEVYIAYGRDGQAEEILREALTRTPKREEVQLKLLEIYAARKDRAAFGRIAGDVHRQTGGKGGSWLKVAAMGYALDPANALYEAGKSAPAVAPSGPITGTDLDFDLGLGAAPGLTTTDITLDAGVAQAATQTVVDTGAVRQEKGDEPVAPLMPDFTLEVPATREPIRADIPLEAGGPSQQAGVIDFQIELPKTEAVAQDQPTIATMAAAGGVDFKIEIPDVNLNLGAEPKTVSAGAGGEKDGHWYDVQTKFDLAKAYQEMGDKAGAREILQEVISEGDAEQKAQAKALLDTLG